MDFPITRLRRLRRTETLRRMVRETRLHPDHLIQPYFVIPGKDEKKPISSMPGVFQLSIDHLVKEAQLSAEAGVPGVKCFGIPSKKDKEGSAAWSADGIVQRATKALKDKVPGVAVIADVCFCEYTNHGHCGVLVNGQVDNDETLENLGKQAISLAEAGVDIVAPSGMMDGMVGAIREALDENGHEQLPIMSYAVKFASAFYRAFPRGC